MTLEVNVNDFRNAGLSQAVNEVQPDPRVDEYEELVKRYFEAKDNADFYKKEMNGIKQAMLAWLEDAGYNMESNGTVADHFGAKVDRYERKGSIDWKQGLVNTGAVRDVDAYGENFRKPSTVVYSVKVSK